MTGCYRPEADKRQKGIGWRAAVTDLPALRVDTPPSLSTICVGSSQAEFRTRRVRGRVSVTRPISVNQYLLAAGHILAGVSVLKPEM